MQISAIIPPDNIVTGTKSLWLDVPNINLAICGTASPINDIGPQNAVTAAVNIPVLRSINILMVFILPLGLRRTSLQGVMRLEVLSGVKRLLNL